MATAPEHRPLSVSTPSASETGVVAELAVDPFVTEDYAPVANAPSPSPASPADFALNLFKASSSIDAGASLQEACATALVPGVARTTSEGPQLAVSPFVTEHCVRVDVTPVAIAPLSALTPSPASLADVARDLFKAPSHEEQREADASAARRAPTPPPDYVDALLGIACCGADGGAMIEHAAPNSYSYDEVVPKDSPLCREKTSLSKGELSVTRRKTDDDMKRVPSDMKRVNTRHRRREQTSCQDGSSSIRLRHRAHHRTVGTRTRPHRDTRSSRRRRPRQRPRLCGSARCTAGSSGGSARCTPR